MTYDGPTVSGLQSSEGGRAPATLGVCNNTEMRIEIAKSSVRMSLQQTYKLHEKHLPDLVVHVKPRLGVKTKKAFEIGQLMLAPLTMNVGHAMPGQNSPTNCLILEDMVQTRDGKQITIYICSSLELGKEGKEKEQCIVPFWAVRKVADSALQNVGFDELAIDVIVASNGAACLEKVTVAIPVFVNTKKLEAGAELLVHEATKYRPSSATPPGKKQKK